MATYEEMEQDMLWFVNGDPEDLTFDHRGSDGKTSDEYSIVSANLGFNFGSFKVESITSYYDRERDTFQPDLIFSALDTFIASATMSGVNGSPTFVQSDAFSAAETNWEQFSQEFRIISNFDGPFNFVAGAFYRDFELELGGGGACNPDYVTLFALPAECTADIANALSPDTPSFNSNEGEQISVFFESTWELNKQWTLITGVRSHKEDIDLAIGGASFTLFTGLADFPLTSATVSVEEVLPKVSVEFTPNEDLLAYLSYSEGVKNGNLNSPISIAQIEALAPGTGAQYNSYEPELAKSIELGLKSTLLDGSLQVNMAAFQTKIEDLQTMQFIGGLFAVITNATDNTSEGFEIESTWAVNENLTLFASGNYVKTENDDDFIFRDLAGTAFDVITPAGTSAPYTPEYTLSVGGQMVFPDLAFGSDLVLNAQYVHTGDYTITFEDNSTELGDYGLFNLSAGLENETWSVKLRVDNLLNTIEVVSIQDLDDDILPFFLTPAAFGGLGLAPSDIPSGFSFNEFGVNRPRTVSASFRYNF